MWKWFEQYFTFTRGEKNGIIALVLLVIAVLIFPSVYLYFKPVQHIDNSRYEKEVSGFVSEHKGSTLSEDSEENSVALSNRSEKPEEHKTFEKKKGTEFFYVDINTADSSEFQKLRGIGPVLARRMVSFRNLLGGYVSKEQIKEVYGITDSTYQSLKGQFKVSKGAIRKININTADNKELNKHPYVRPAAKAIIAYRKKNGDFSAVSDLKKIESIADSTFRKMEPYLTVK